MNILVTGGAGYIGSHVLRELEARDHRAIIFDDLSTGHTEAVAERRLIKGSILDAQLLRTVLAREEIDAVIHLAALIEVGESTRAPERYYRTNVTGSLTLAEEVLRAGVRKFVFSSSAAVYGMPVEDDIGEDHLTAPVNPYGQTKLDFERCLGWLRQAHQLDYVSLRYFNAAGADEGGAIGEDHADETHLIPLVLGTALGKREYVEVYGDDYDTEDGTCVRDYVHVTDLARAHVLALDVLEDGFGGASG